MRSFLLFAALLIPCVIGCGPSNSASVPDGFVNGPREAPPDPVAAGAGSAEDVAPAATAPALPPRNR